MHDNLLYFYLPKMADLSLTSLSLCLSVPTEELNYARSRENDGVLLFARQSKACPAAHLIR